MTYALFLISHNEIVKDTVFKGGTALSKCFKIIERFSEDIDFVLIRRDGESNNKLTSKLRKISKIICMVLPEVTVEGVTNKKGMNRKTVHSYSKEYSGDYGQIRDTITVEATRLGEHEPVINKQIISYTGNMMYNNGQSELAEENGLMPFTMQVLEPTRTICEKIMSLVRFSYELDPIEALKKKIRHTYDLYQLLRQPEYNKFFNSQAFDEMMYRVANADIISFKNNNQWLVYHPSESMFFKELESVWKELNFTYNGEFRKLVYGEFPDHNMILDTLKLIQQRIKRINWTIEI